MGTKKRRGKGREKTRGYSPSLYKLKVKRNQVIMIIMQTDNITQMQGHTFLNQNIINYSAVLPNVIQESPHNFASYYIGFERVLVLAEAVPTKPEIKLFSCHL